MILATCSTLKIAWQMVIMAMMAYKATRHDIINSVCVEYESGSPQNWDVASKNIDADGKLMQAWVASLWAIEMNSFDVNSFAKAGEIFFFNR